MAEQYIYSRAEKEFTNALNQTVSGGFGFIAFSPGMNNALKDAAKAHCQDCPRLSQTDSQGAALPLLRKVRLPKGQTLLQESSWIEGEGRSFHVAHGYVLGDEEIKQLGPGKWFDALFRLGNPNAEEDGILLESRFEFAEGEAFRARPLKAAMEGIDRKTFCQLLLACIDAVKSGRQVLIAWDFGRPDERELRCSVLYWVYTCLPYSLRSALGFDSVYTEMSIPGQIHLAFADRSTIQAMGKNTSIQTGGQSRLLGGNFVVLDGTIIHNDSKYPTDWYGQNNFYARWLEEVVNTLWACSEEDQASVTQALAEFYKSFQELLDIRGEQPDPNWYGAACMKTVRSMPQALAETYKRVWGSVTEPELYEFRLAFMSSLTAEEQMETLEDLIRKHQNKSAPADEADIKMLCLLSENGQKEPVAGFLGALFAQEIDGCGEVAAVMKRYQEMLPPELYSMLPERVLFSRADEKDAQYWAECDVDCSDRAAEQRRDIWFKENVPADTDIWGLPADIRKALAALKGLLSDKQLAVLWWGPVKARCKAASESGKTISDLANDQNLPLRFDTLQQELSSLPGGVQGVKDELGQLQQKAYHQILANPAPFVNAQWLCKIKKLGGEAGEMLEVLRSFTDKDRGDLQSWAECCEGKSKQVQRQLLEDTLPTMFLNGMLPKLDYKFVEVFLLLSKDNSRRILLQTASQGGSALLLDLVRHAWKYPIKYPNRLEPGDPTLFSIIAQMLKEDKKIAEKLKEKGGGSAAFYNELTKLLQAEEAEAKRTSGFGAAADAKVGAPAKSGGTWNKRGR